MTIKIKRNHEPADLSAHSGMLLNRDFGWHLHSMPRDVSLAEVLDPEQLSARISRLERRLKTASITLWTLTSGVVVFLLTWL